MLSILTSLISGPKGLRADIGSLKRFRISSIGRAKKFLFLSRPVGPRSDIASKRGFFVSHFDRNG